MIIINALQPKFEYYFDLLSGDPEKNGVRVTEKEFFEELKIPQTCTTKYHPGNINRLDFYDGPHIIGCRITASRG